MKKYQITIQANEGYSANQINGSLTVGEVKEMLDGLEDDAIIITLDNNNKYGAMFGKLNYGIETIYEDEDEDED